MSRARIGITTYGRGEANRFSLPAEYVDAVRRAGATVALLPPGEEDLAAWLGMVDGIILAGGGDIDPSHYGGASHETIYLVDSERDGSELALAKRIIDTGMPALGVCRGAQVMNVALGGSLYPHLPEEFGEAVRHRLPPREPTSHDIEVDTGSRLAEILGTTSFRSASWHHQAVREVAKSLASVARSPDGVIEAIESKDHPWLIGVQWHPEITAAEDPVQQRLFDALVAEASSGRKR